MLKFKQTTKSPPPNSSHPTSAATSSASASINPAFSNVKCEPCKASIVIHNITIPLAWPASEYFDHKGEWREFNVCLSMKAAGGKLMRSKIHQRVNRTITDLQFDESFVFSDLEPDFTIEALVSAKRINTPRNGSSSSPFQSVANTVSRSFGRRFGANYKKYSQAQNSYTISAYNFPSREEIFSSPVEDLLPVGRCFFRLENAGLSGKIRVYSLALVSAETINPLLPSSDLLPLFGTMCSQVLCVPDCLQITFIRSILDIFYVDEQLLLEKLECALEGGCIKCFTKDNKKEAALIIPIDQRTKIRATAYQTAIRITLLDDETQYTRDFIFILSNENQITDWSYALQQQIANATAWKEFASISTNPFALKYGSSEFKKPFDDTASMKGRTMTNTDEIKGEFKNGLREFSKRGDRRRVQSVFKDIPATSSSTTINKNESKSNTETKEYSKLKVPTEAKGYVSKSNEKSSHPGVIQTYNQPPQGLKDYSKPRSTSIPKLSPTDYSTSTKSAASKQASEIQRPKIVETKPIPKPRLIDQQPPKSQPTNSRPRLTDSPSSSTSATTTSKPPPSKQIILVNRGYVSSPTKTSPRIPRKEPPTQTKTSKYIDSVKSIPEENEPEPEPKPLSRQNVKLEFKEDTVEHNRLLPHRVSRPQPPSSHVNTSIPVIVKHPSAQHPKNNNNSNKTPPNTYIIRLNVGMDEEDDHEHGSNRNKNRDIPIDRKPPPPYPSSRYQPHPQAPTKAFTRSSHPKSFNDSIAHPPPPPLPSQQPPQPTVRQKIVPPASSSSTAAAISSSKYSSKLPKFFNTNYETEITRL